jgi:hypothetical protein
LGVFLLCLITFRGEDLEGFVGDEGLRLVEIVSKYRYDIARMILLGEPYELIYHSLMDRSLSKIRTTLSCFVASGSSLLAADQAVDTTPVPEPSAILIGGLCGIFFLLWRRK